MRKRYIAIVFLALCSTLAAQEALNNDSVIKLLKAGLSDDLIISTINGSPGKFDTSAEGIIALKSAGASDKLVLAIMSKTAAASPAAKDHAPLPRPAAQDPNDPMAPHDPGIYLITVASDGSRKMVLVPPANPRSKETNQYGSALLMGIPTVKEKTIIPGTRAAVRTTEARPEFYMYFPPAGTMGLANTISSPSQFILRMLESEKGYRETAILQTSGYQSFHAPKHDKSAISFDFKAIRQYAFKVTPNVDLKAGEYVFIEESWTTTANSTTRAAHISYRVFDFGVD